MKIIDISKPKRMYWDSYNEIEEGCPVCEKELINEEHIYLIEVNVKNKLIPIIISNKNGHFCPDCPVAVLERFEFKHMTATVSGIVKPEFKVTGIINLDEIPEDQKDLALGEEGSPIPLVAFIDDDDDDNDNDNDNKEDYLDFKRQDEPPVQPAKSEKIGRNAPCPCGSGKKYKKCCL